MKPGMRHSKPGPPRNVLVLLIAVAAVSVAALVWLSWRLLEQDRALENQRIQERLERTADLIVTSLDLGLSEIENRLSAHVRSKPIPAGVCSIIPIFHRFGNPLSPCL